MCIRMCFYVFRDGYKIMLDHGHRKTEFASKLEKWRTSVHPQAFSLDFFFHFSFFRDREVCCLALLRLLTHDGFVCVGHTFVLSTIYIWSGPSLYPISSDVNLGEKSLSRFILVTIFGDGHGSSRERESQANTNPKVNYSSAPPRGQMFANTHRTFGGHGRNQLCHFLLRINLICCSHKKTSRTFITQH